MPPTKQVSRQRKRKRSYIPLLDSNEPYWVERRAQLDKEIQEENLHTQTTPMKRFEKVLDKCLRVDYKTMKQLIEETHQQNAKRRENNRARLSLFVNIVQELQGNDYAPIDEVEKRMSGAFSTSSDFNLYVRTIYKERKKRKLNISVDKRDDSNKRRTTHIRIA